MNSDGFSTLMSTPGGGTLPGPDATQPSQNRHKAHAPPPAAADWENEGGSLPPCTSEFSAALAAL